MAERPELARVVREGFLSGRGVALTEVLRRGVERGDLRRRGRSRARPRRARRAALLPAADHRRPDRRTARRRRDRADPARLRTRQVGPRQVQANNKGAAHDEDPRNPDRNGRRNDALGAKASATASGVYCNTFATAQWTEPLPIYAFAIEHPEGVIVVDTGETAGASKPGYFPSWHPGFRCAVREWVEPEQEIGPQLERLGISAGRCALGGDDPPTHRPRWRPAPLPRQRDPRHAHGTRPSHRACAAACAATSRTRAGQPGSGQPCSSSSREPLGPFPAEPATDRRRRRHARPGPRPHPRPDRRARRRRRPDRLPRGRQLLHPGPDAARQRSTASAPTTKRNGLPTNGSAPTPWHTRPSTSSPTTRRPGLGSPNVGSCTRPRWRWRRDRLRERSGHRPPGRGGVRLRLRPEATSPPGTRPSETYTRAPRQRTTPARRTR